MRGDGLLGVLIAVAIAGCISVNPMFRRVFSVPRMSAHELHKDAERETLVAQCRIKDDVRLAGRVHSLLQDGLRVVAG